MGKIVQRHRFLYSVAGLAVGMLLPGGPGRAAGGRLDPAGGLTVPAAAAADLAANTIYLTFDDGNLGLAEKLAALRALGVPATFFLTGEAVKAHPHDVQTLVNDGHRLGNHTWHHRDLTKLSPSGVMLELNASEAAVRGIVGVSTLPLLRPPNRAVNPAVRSIAAGLGYETILWDWDTRDWGGASAAYMEQNFGPGIVLMHTQGPHTVAALANVVPSLAEQGYGFSVL
jgi:peptidoglycan/xylan/chitin deacetylase (PgdA/CDA1 family)